MRKLTLLTIMTLSFAWNANAQDAPAPVDSAAAAPVEEEGKLTISGYVDAYYNVAFNKPFSGSLLGASGAGRAFDREVDQFQLGLIQTKIGYSTSKFDFVGDIVYGPNAAYGNFGNSSALTPGLLAGRPIGESALAIKQAYGTWKATDKLSITVGQFGTHIGYEVIDAPVNYHYSLSNLFNNGPFYHLGAKANYAVSDKVAIMVGLVNNWDAIYDNNKQKSVIAQVYLKPKENMNVYLNYIGGTESNPDPAPGRAVHLWDLTAGYQVTDKLYFGVNAAYGLMTAAGDTAVKSANLAAIGRENMDWWGVAVYPNFKINDWLGLGVRYEYFEDFYGIRYIGAAGGVINNSLTVTAPITVAGGRVIFKPEFRYDGATTFFGSGLYEGAEDVDATGAGLGYGKPVYEQTTLGLATIFKF